MSGNTSTFLGLGGPGGGSSLERKREVAEYRQLETDKKLSASTQVPGCWAFL